MGEFSLIKFEGKALEKLIDVISKAFGKLYLPQGIKREADAKAYEIEVIQRAKSKAQAQKKEMEADLYDRIHNRVINNERRKQTNIDKITEISADQLKLVETVAEEAVDDDWITKFFDIIGDVSNEEMQRLWGKILAGEIKQPGTYSLRTLGLLRNLSKNEAGVIMKVANFVINFENNFYILSDLIGKYGVTQDDVSLLIEVGFIKPQDLITDYLEINDISFSKSVKFSYGPLQRQFEGVLFKEISLTVFKITRSGKEILRLVDIKPNPEYYQDVVNEFAKKMWLS